MEDAQLQANYFDACVCFMEQNGGTGSRAPADLFGLVVKNGKIEISLWKHESKQPNDTQLKALTLEQVETSKRRRIVLHQAVQRQALKLTTAERNSLGAVDEGLTVFNSTTKKLEIYVNGAWHALAFEA